MCRYINERWKQVEGFESYAVSDHGRVKRLAYVDWRGTSKSDRILRFGGDQYRLVILYKEKIPHMKKVHRLVAAAFLPPPLHSGLQINHIDSNHYNNHYTNLEWCTGLENI